MPNKNFSNLERMNNPVYKFIPQAEPETTQEAQEEPQAEERPGSKYVAAVDPYNETRTRRVQLVMRPSLYAGLKYIAKRRKQSINNLVESIVFEYVEKAKQEDKRPKG